jgi:hypothetical protein
MKVGARRLADEPPAVDNSNAGSDAAYFAANPDKRFRGYQSADGRVWITRAMPRGGENTFLRVRTGLTRMPRQDGAALAFLFFSACWPDLPPIEVRRLARRSLRGAAR